MTHQLFLAHNPSFLLFSEELFSDTRLNLFNQVNQFVQFTKSIKNNLIMQNKPNLTAPQMNISSVLTKHYENKPRLPAPPKQTQSNPIPTPPFLPPKSPLILTGFTTNYFQISFFQYSLIPAHLIEGFHRSKRSYNLSRRSWSD